MTIELFTPDMEGPLMNLSSNSSIERHFTELSPSGWNITTETLEFPERHSTLYIVVAVCLFSIIFTVGFIGNILVIVVVCRSKSMRTLTNYYLVSLAVSDCLVLVSATLPAIPEFFFYIGEWLYGPAMCSLLVFLQYLGINASALSITAFTIERYIGICHPMKAQVICTVKRARYIICSLWGFSVLYNAAWLYLSMTKTDIYSNGVQMDYCTFRISRDLYRSIYMVDLILFYLVPLVLTCVLYTLIACTLHKSTNDMKKPLKPVSEEKPTIEKLIIHRPAIKRQRQTLMGDRKDLLKRMQKARLQVVKMLTVIAVLFAVLWLPYRAWVVYNSFAPQHRRFYNNWFYLMARSMIFLNSAINPVLYSAMSKKFRRAFLTYTCLKSYLEYQSAATGGQVTRGVSGCSIRLNNPVVETKRPLLNSKSGPVGV